MHVHARSRCKSIICFFFGIVCFLLLPFLLLLRSCRKGCVTEVGNFREAKNTAHSSAYPNVFCFPQALCRNHPLNKYHTFKARKGNSYVTWCSDESPLYTLTRLARIHTEYWYPGYAYASFMPHSHSGSESEFQTVSDVGTLLSFRCH